jgi:hypothetical protein
MTTTYTALRAMTIGALLIEVGKLYTKAGAARIAADELDLAVGGTDTNAGRYAAYALDDARLAFDHARNFAAHIDLANQHGLSSADGNEQLHRAFVALTEATESIKRSTFQIRRARTGFAA